MTSFKTVLKIQSKSNSSIFKDSSINDVVHLFQTQFVC